MKVEDYVRTKKYGIIKIKKIIKHKDKLELHDENWHYYIYKEDDIVGCSKNIVNLIEEGDYVNGEKVITVNNFAENPIHYFVNTRKETYYTSDIKSILTKEQFEFNQHKVGD